MPPVPHFWGPGAIFASALRRVSRPNRSLEKFEVSRYEIDNVVMLLSADWFFPHWHLIGIFANDRKKSLLREGCREIVRQIMGTSTQYYGTNFSVARVKETRAMLDSLIKRCDLEQVSANRISGLISRGYSPIDDGTRWLLVIMTEQLLDRSVDASIDTAITEGLRKEWNQLENLDKIDFQASCLNSASNWDRYLRNATPDQPTMLADQVFAVASDSKFDLLWGFINMKLTFKQKPELLSWYRSRAQSLTGQPLRLATDA